MARAPLHAVGTGCPVLGGGTACHTGSCCAAVLRRCCGAALCLRRWAAFRGSVCGDVWGLCCVCGDVCRAMFGAVAVFAVMFRGDVSGLLPCLW